MQSIKLLQLYIGKTKFTVQLIIAFAERHPKLISSQKKSGFFETKFQIVWPLERT